MHKHPNQTTDVPKGPLGETRFGAIGTAEQGGAKDDGVCVAETCEGEFGEAFGSGVSRVHA